MKTLFLETNELYDGAQLTSLRNYLKFGLLGDSIVSWIGPCNVTPEHMVDGEDLLAKAEIRGDKMLHFTVELFDSTLFAAVGVQRLLAAIVKDALRSTSPKTALITQLTREGDDIFCDDGKLSISIATQSPTSSLIHFAVNVVNRGTPVRTISLEEFGVEPVAFAKLVMDLFSREMHSIREATRKVRWVK